jgi:hypothetical protein
MDIMALRAPTNKEPAARLPHLALAREEPGAAKQRGREAALRVPSQTTSQSD